MIAASWLDHYASFIQLLFTLALFEAVLGSRHRGIFPAPLISTVIAAVLFASVIEGASRSNRGRA